MTSHAELRGIFPALPTPIIGADQVDCDAVKTLLTWLTQAGIDGVLPIGGTGENGALPRAERIKMVRVCAEFIEGRVPIVAGVLDPGFHDALQSGIDFAHAGATALLVVAPYYTNSTQAGLRDYFTRYADLSPVPILIYDIPYRTRVVITPETLHGLSRHPNIIGMKACNPDMYHFLQTVAGIDPEFSILSGEDTLFPVQMAVGARGGMLVTANLFPRAWRSIYDAQSEGRSEHAVKLHRELIPLLNLCFSETNPGPMKAIMDLIGVRAPAVLTPLVQPAPALAQTLRHAASILLARFEGIEAQQSLNS